MSSLTNCLQQITDLFEKYKDNPYMLQRVNNHVLHYLPNTLSNEWSNYEKRVDRQNFLTNEQQIFIQVFLSKNQYFYLPNNSYFYEYNGKQYTIVKEDDIIHKLLSNISKDRVLLQWKYKTKINIVKQIKDRNLFDSIPETDTIQHILNLLCPLIFSSKNEAKYFLTIVGDNIRKKNPNHIFLVSKKIKKMLAELDSIAYSTIGNTNTTHNFMTQYHENYPYENCRLVKINETISPDLWKNIMRNNGLDLLCVAAHYSKRYIDSDQFIDNKADEDLKTYAYYLKLFPQSLIVDSFCSKCVIKSNSVNIEWKNLHFIWKQYLSGLHLPSIIYSNTLKTNFKNRFKYDESSDTFLNVTSRYLPIHSDFIQFWDTTMTLYNEENQDNELEVDEICSLFKIWAKNNDESLMSNGNINEENVIKILKHFFPDVEIVDDKYILNVKCILWDKNKDIQDSFDFIREQVKSTLLEKKVIKENECEHMSTLISFDDAYNYYYKYCGSLLKKMIVSKRYFEKYLYENIQEHIIYEKFIETEWFLTDGN